MAKRKDQFGAGSLMGGLIGTLPQIGEIKWIGVRPGRDEPMVSAGEVRGEMGRGLVGDRFAATHTNKREVTLIQAEHIIAVASMLGDQQLEPSVFRRNLVVSGINLLALKDKTFRVGDLLLTYSGLAHPCSKMERALGPGGYNAMRGHGGITASIYASGSVRVGDPVQVFVDCDSP